MRYTDISFDLETLGVAPGCVITQIGACAFNANASPGVVGAVEPQNFSAHIEPQSCLDLGMTVAWSTIAWWLQQPEAARMAEAKKASGLLGPKP